MKNILGLLNLVFLLVIVTNRVPNAESVLDILKVLTLVMAFNLFWLVLCKIYSMDL